MTIRRGSSWGESVPAPDDIVLVGSDSELAARLAGTDARPVQLVGGDLLATLGGPSRGTGRQRFPIDVLRVRADGRDVVAVAHVVARGRSRWRGPLVAALNVDRIGRWDVAPRAHPGDGRFDVVEVDAAMSLRDRWQAWRRLPTGTHVPHPAIHVRTTTSISWKFDDPQRLWVDGVARGTVRSLDVVVEPDAAVVHI